MFLKTFLFGQFVGPFVRHAATAIGGAMVVKGYADEQTASEIIGGIIAAGGVLASLVEKKVRFQ